jgi:DNA-binding MarR family transcriptional regulator
VMIEITDEGKSFLKEIKNRRKKFLSGLLNRIKQEDIKRILESLDILYSAVLKYSEKKDA